jgi:uncharacterized surface protein with fasciclin (FAS1) repeats
MLVKARTAAAWFVLLVLLVPGTSGRCSRLRSQSLDVAQEGKQEQTNGISETELLSAESLQFLGRVLQEFGSLEPTPRPTPAPTPVRPTITEFIEGEPDLSILSAALRRVSGFDVDFRPIFNETFPIPVNARLPSVSGLFFPFGRRNLRFQKNNTFRTNNLFNILNEPGNEPGGYTFFAPTNTAFSRSLPADLWEILFTDEDFLPHLEDLLLFHGLEGEQFISEFDNRNYVTFNTETVVVRKPNVLSTLRVGGTPVGDSSSTDNDASNGVAHKLSGVLRPVWLRNSVLDFTRTNDDLSMFHELLSLSGLGQELGQVPGKYGPVGSGLTLLAPTNDAFNGTYFDFLRDPANRVELERILRYHIVDGVFTSPRLMNGSNIPTESGSTITVSVVDQIIMFNQATATSESILASNGVLYEISAVLDPDTGTGF